MKQKYFRQEQEIESQFRQAFQTLQERGYDAASTLFEEAFQCDPYDMAVHCQLAVWFARDQNMEECLYHLEVCYDLDPSYFEKILEEPVIIGCIGESGFRSIEEGRLGRMWQVMNFKQVEPVYHNTGIWLQVNDGDESYLKEFYTGLHERVQGYFKWQDRFFWIESDCDRRYCGYEMIYVALKEISPFVKDIRFFMNCESRPYVDEIQVIDGHFYSYRHFVEDSSRLGHLSLYERLLSDNPVDKYLQQLIGSEYFSWAKRNIKSGRIEEVKAVIDKVLTFAPEHAGISYLLFQYHSWAGNGQDATTFLLKSAGELMAGYEELYDAGILEINRQNYKQALGYLNRAIANNQDAPDAYLKAGIACQYLELTTEANNYYDQFIKKTPDHSYAALINAGDELFEKFNGYDLIERCYLSSISKATSYMENVHEKNDGIYRIRKIQMTNVISNAYTRLCAEAPFPGTKSSYENKLLLVEPNSETSWFNKGRLYEQKGDIAAAEFCYQEGLICRNEDLKKHNNQAQYLYEKHEYKQVLTIAAGVVEKDPGNITGWTMIGATHISLRNYEQALEAYIRIIGLEPAFSVGYQGAGQANQGMKRYAEAIVYYNKALEIDPSLYLILSDLDKCYQSQKDQLQ